MILKVILLFPNHTTPMFTYRQVLLQRKICSRFCKHFVKATHHIYLAWQGPAVSTITQSNSHAEKRIGYDVLSENTNFHQASGQLLQQILQHFWSLNSGSQFTSVESIYDEGESQSGTEESLKYCDEESDFDSIPDHGGWVIKRTRESILKGESDVLFSSVTEEHGALRHILCRGPFSATFGPLLKNFFRSVYHFGSQKIFPHIPQFFLKTKIFFRKHLRCLLPLSMFIYCNTV
jgi:hypothetical protein